MPVTRIAGGATLLAVFRARHGAASLENEPFGHAPEPGAEARAPADQRPSKQAGA